VFRRLSDVTDAALALTDVFRFPTVRTFAAHLARAASPAPDGPVAGLAPGPDRGALRREALARRSRAKR
jgi:hypothetical protein